MSNTLQIIQSKEEQTLEVLKKLVNKKKKTLMQLTEKHEQLQIELDAISEEYTLRIGRLYIRDNVLDMEIIRWKKINSLMDIGLSFTEAASSVDGKYPQKQQEEDFVFVADVVSEQTEDMARDIKKLWKKLVHTFHPDLAQNIDEKKKREDIMKKINNAYAKKDFDTLHAIAEKELIVEIEIDTLNQLQKLYVDIENAIIRLRENLKNLKKSQWYGWRKRSKEEKEFIFSQLEKKILEDIMMKNLLLRNLKRKRNNA